MTSALSECGACMQAALAGEQSKLWCSLLQTLDKAPQTANGHR